MHVCEFCGYNNLVREPQSSLCLLTHKTALDPAVHKLCCTKQGTALAYHQAGPPCHLIKGLQRLN